MSYMDMNLCKAHKGDTLKLTYSVEYNVHHTFLVTMLVDGKVHESTPWSM